MSFASFLANPKGYLKTHEMQLNGAGAVLMPAAMTRGAPVANAASGQSVQFTHNANVQLVQGHGTAGTNFAASALRTVGIMGRRSLTYVPATGGAHANFRILPWEGTNVTFMQLGGGANFAVTGPLTGCTVAVANHGGAIWFFHANVAGGGGVGLANRMTKQQMIQNAGATVGIPVGAYSYCQYKVGGAGDYDGLAFVWGRQRAGGVWKFYVHEIAAGAGGAANTVNNTKWAQI